MRSLKIAVLFSIVALISGCIVSSLQPLYIDESKDVVYDPLLIGGWSWSDKEKTETLTFAQSGGKVYEITYTADSATAKFYGRLVQVGSSKYLDVYPQEQDIDTGSYQNGLYKLMTINPTHFFVQVKDEGDVLKIAILDLDKLKKMLDAKKGKIAHALIDDRIILTASPAEMQKFIAKSAQDLLSGEQLFYRQKNP